MNEKIKLETASVAEFASKAHSKRKSWYGEKKWMWLWKEEKNSNPLLSSILMNIVGCR